jgi:L-threonylcarbamoyladenylate synthase
MTSVVKADQLSNLHEAAEELRRGGLVAFPTETVYGLGADAGSADAVARIFAVKGRPHTDPLIVHCFSIEQSELFLSPDTNSWQRNAHSCLAHAFWPGPLTLILPYHPDRISHSVTGGSGWVGLRCPNHPVALQFLKVCAVPVAAPSANLFGHVSPTSAQHVLSDFPAVDNLWIVDGGECGIGIESTVLRVNADQSMDILRLGGIGKSEIVQLLVSKAVFKDLKTASERIRIVEKFIKQPSDSHALAAPGQLLVHYAPRLKAHLVSVAENVDDSNSTAFGCEQLSKTIVIDFAGMLKKLDGVCGFYRDLSVAGSAHEAAQLLFSALRWAEERASGPVDDWQIWLANIPLRSQAKDDEMLAAVADRVFRAASGRVAVVGLKQDFDQVFFSIR